MKIKKKKLLFWGVIIVFFGSIFIRQQVVISNLNKKKEQYGTQLKQLQEKNKELATQVELTKSNDYIEKVAREKLGFIKSGEILFIDKDKND